eukprot:TRINITY_DN5547_c0_g1_i2.p1 TRINITY_DN5547_c0_g1~~TRINITY_DN5547_c0_g1_i2.p1  ORF type:complete len:234 (+),score=98.35 TRINITY_DN5547_c0_g1_i2:65-766(+)
MAVFNPASLFHGLLEAKNPELSVLADLEQVLVVQSVEKLALLTGFDGDQHYKVINDDDKTLFNCAEHGSTTGKMLHGKDRDMRIHIVAKGAKESLFVLERPWTLTGQKAYLIEKSGDEETRIGRLKRRGGLHNLSAHYEVHCETPDKETLFYARALAILPFKLTNFGLYDKDDNEIEGGFIKKDFSVSSFLKSKIGDADSYEVQFPPSFGVEARAALIAMAIFIDLIFFEEDD